MVDLRDFIRRNPFMTIQTAISAIGVGVLLIVIAGLISPTGPLALLLAALGGFIIAFAGVLLVEAVRSIGRSFSSGFHLGVEDSTTAEPTSAAFPVPPVPGFIPGAPIDELNPLTAPGGTCVYFQFDPPVADEYATLGRAFAELFQT